MIYDTSMDTHTNKIHASLVELERLAEHILQDKRTIIDLDRKRNDNRVALRQMRHLSDYNNKTWITLGNTFFQLDTDDVKGIIQQDQQETEKQINQLRDGMKEKTVKLQELEGKPIVKGFNLKPLNEEIQAMLPNRPY